jgi:putative ABC transport system permease protein
MINQLFHSPAAVAAAQAAVAFILALFTVLLARQQGIHLESESLVALVRGLVQMVAVGLVLVALLDAPLWTSIPVLAAMILFASATASRRAKAIPGGFLVSLISIGLGAGVMIGLLTWLGVISGTINTLVPVGSMLIANAMNTCAQAVERFQSDVTTHVGQVEAGLALGADPRITVQPYVRSAVQASMIPRIDTLRSLGIVWIPGLMAGMTLSGSNPVYAAVYQFVVIALIYASSGITAILATLLVRGRAFSVAEQLTLRPAEQ